MIYHTANHAAGAVPPACRILTLAIKPEVVMFDTDTISFIPILACIMANTAFGAVEKVCPKEIFKSFCPVADVFMPNTPDCIFAFRPLRR